MVAACPSAAPLPTCLLPLPPPLSQHAAYFGTYEALKHALAAHQGIPVTQLSSLSLMTAGGIGGAAFWVAVYPMDVRRGADSGGASGSTHSMLKTSCTRLWHDSAAVAAAFIPLL